MIGVKAFMALRNYTNISWNQPLRGAKGNKR